MVEATATTPSSRLAAQMATVKEMRTSMDNDPQLSVFMDGLRGKGQDVSDFAASGVTMRVVEVDSVAGSEDSLPLEYEPESIARFWGKRPAAVVQRCFQLLGIAGKFLGNLAFDAWRGKLAETEGVCSCFLHFLSRISRPALHAIRSCARLRAARHRHVPWPRIHQARPGFVHSAGPSQPCCHARAAEAVRQSAIVPQRSALPRLQPCLARSRRPPRPHVLNDVLLRLSSCR